MHNKFRHSIPKSLKEKGFTGSTDADQDGNTLEVSILRACRFKTEFGLAALKAARVETANGRWRIKTIQKA